MASIVYILCALTSLACSILLFRGYSANKFRLLFWSGIGFAGFSINNIILFVDESVIHHIDFSVARTVPGAIGIIIMVYGLITEEI